MWQVSRTEEPGKVPGLQTRPRWELQAAGPPGTATGRGEGRQEGRRVGRLI